MTRRSRRIAPLVLAVSTVVLAACGGSSNSSTPFTLTAAVLELGQTNFSGRDPNQGAASASAAGLNQPSGGTASDSTSGQFYIPDFGNSRVLGFSTTPTVNNATANFVLGQADFTSVTPGTAPTAGSAVRLAFPASIWIDNAGSKKFAVVDSGNNRVLIWNAAPSGNTAPDVVIGQADLSSSVAPSPPTASSLASPAAVAIANNKLIVVDQGNNRVLIWNAVPTSNNAPADIVLGQSDFTSGNANQAPSPAAQGTETASTMKSPQGVWTDGFRLLIADSGNSRVLFYSNIPTVSAGASALYVMGQSSFTFSTAATSSVSMSNPVGVASDGARVFVADQGGNRVLVLPFPTGNGQPATAVLGQENFVRNVANDDNGKSNDPQDGQAETLPTQRTLSGPTGVYYAGGKLYVTDRGNNRVMIYDGNNFPVPGNS
jgi:hypothetical protein